VTDLYLILAVAAITFASRVAFLLKPRSVPAGLVGRFLDVFPLALFIAIAAQGLLAPNGTPEVTPALAGLVGGVLGGIVFKRNLWGVLASGALLFYLARAVFA
jgi:branched-subunit amino acid transport protein